jgi:nucleoside-diphosphate-sugar epimerase
MKYAVVTGGLGLIGTFISKQLIEKKYVDKVVCLDHFGRYASSTKKDFEDYRNLRYQLMGNNLIIERGDSKYYSVIYKIIDKYKPLYIFHLAALPLAKLDNLCVEEALEGSVTSTSNIIEYLGYQKKTKNYSPLKFIFASSSMVYGDFKFDSITEDVKPNPKEIYGIMKYSGEIITQGLCKFYDIKFNIIRPSAVYGPTDMNKRVVQIFIENAMKGIKIKVEGINEFLDFTYVYDTANGFVLAATNTSINNEIFNITYGKAHSLLELVKVLKSEFADLKYEILERDEYRPKRGTLSINKAKKLLGYKPNFNLKNGIRDYINFIKKNNI